MSKNSAVNEQTNWFQFFVVFLQLTWLCTSVSAPRCSSSEFQCRDQSCIPLTKKCDGTADCHDRSDEFDCPTPGKGLLSILKEAHTWYSSVLKEACRLYSAHSTIIIWYTNYMKLIYKEDVYVFADFCSAASWCLLIKLGFWIVYWKLLCELNFIHVCFYLKIIPDLIFSEMVLRTKEIFMRQNLYHVCMYRCCFWKYLHIGTTWKFDDCNTNKDSLGSICNVVINLAQIEVH